MAQDDHPAWDWSLAYFGQLCRNQRLRPCRRCHGLILHCQGVSRQGVNNAPVTLPRDFAHLKLLSHTARTVTPLDD
jgi:hypothetical protein